MREIRKLRIGFDAFELPQNWDDLKVKAFVASIMELRPVVDSTYRTREKVKIEYSYTVVNDEPEPEAAPEIEEVNNAA